MRRRPESNSQSKYVALKIQAASVDVTNELRIQQHLAISFSKDSSSHFFLLRSDWFILEGPNGEHICFVTEPIGPSTAGVPNAPHEFYDPLPAESRPRETTAFWEMSYCGWGFFTITTSSTAIYNLEICIFSLRDISRLAPTELQQNESNAQLDHIVRRDGRVDRCPRRTRLF